MPRNASITAAVGNWYPPMPEIGKTTIREYRVEDLPALIRLYSDSIRQSGPPHYSQRQVDAWAGFARDRTRFADWLAAASTFVALDERLDHVGFAGLQECGRIASLFVAPAWQRLGIGSRLLSCLFDLARRRGLTYLCTEASELSMPLFRKFGFEIEAVERTTIDGVDLQRYRMLMVSTQAGSEAT